jgi:hypothetical protein
VLLHRTCQNLLDGHAVAVLLPACKALALGQQLVKALTQVHFGEDV